MDLVSFEGGGGDFEFALVEVFGAVAFGSLEVPGFDGEVLMFHGGGIDLIGEGDFDAVFFCVEGDGEVGGFFGFADAVETAGFSLGGGPGEHATAVELAIGGTEAAAHDAGGELLEGEFAEAALALVADFFVRDDVDFSVAVGEVEELAVEGAPFCILGNPEEFGGGAVELVGDPAERVFHGGVCGVGNGGVAVDVAEEFGGAVAVDPVDAVLGIPVTFLVGDDEGAIGVEADAIGGAEAGGEDVGAGAVGADAEEGAVVGDEGVFGVAGGFGVVEVSVGVGLEAHREFVEVLGDLVVVVEALDVVDGFVAILVVEFGELVSAGDMDFVIDDLEAEGLEEAGADALPCEGAFELVDTFDDPDVAHPGADGGALAVGIEVEAACAHPGVVGIFAEVGDGESVDGEGAGLVTALDLGGDGDGGKLILRGATSNDDG